MPNLVNSARNSVSASCQVTECKRDGCSASLNSCPTNRVVIDMDCDEVRNLQTQKICDYVVFAQENQNSWIIPIELKSGKFKASQVAKQLQDGIEIVTRWISFEKSYKVVPLLFRGRHVGVHPKELRKLKQKKIKYGKKNYQIYLLKCGDSFSKYIN